jgi:hypothetical protein
VLSKPAAVVAGCTATDADTRVTFSSSPGPYHDNQLDDHQFYPEIPDEWDSPDDDDSHNSDDFRGEPYLCSPSSSAYEVSAFELSASPSASTSPTQGSAPNPDYLPDEFGAVALTGMAATQLSGWAGSGTFQMVQAGDGDVNADELDLDLDDRDQDHDYHSPLSPIDVAEEDPDLYDYGPYSRAGAGISVGADASDDYDGYESPGDVFDDYDGVDDYDGDVFGDYDDDF